MKKMISIIATLSLMFSTVIMAKAPVIHHPTERSPTLSNMLKDVLPVVVNITVHGNIPVLPSQLQKGKKPLPGQSRPGGRPFMPMRKFASNGSGIIVDAHNGYIVTNAHVVRYANVVIVTLNDGRMLKAKIIGVDPATDVAVIQVKDKYLKSIPFANSSKVEPGDFVAAIGNPFGIGQTVTSGVVSALHRSIGIEGPGGYEDFIQTDAPINPGNSGGALVDMHGRLVGINTAILAPLGGNIGIGFAIPSNMVKSVMNQLVKFHSVKRGMLGVMVQSLTPDLADAFAMKTVKGAIVTNIVPDSPADHAGLKTEDVIMTINGEPVKNAAQLRSTIGLLAVGNTAEMKIRRGNKYMMLTAVIESATKIKKQKHGSHFLQGVRLNNFFQLDMDNKELKGVIVLNVNDASDAWLAGLRRGDVILTANGKKIEDISILAHMADDNPDKLLLNVRRGMANLYLVIT